MGASVGVGASVVAGAVGWGTGVRGLVGLGAGVLVAVSLGSDEADRVGLARGVGEWVFAGAGFVSPLLTWVIVVPVPPDRACPEISSYAVRAPAAMAKAANALTTMVFQLTRPPVVRETVSDGVARGALGWAGAQALDTSSVGRRASTAVGTPPAELSGSPVRPVKTVRTFSWVRFSEAV